RSRGQDPGRASRLRRARVSPHVQYRARGRTGRLSLASPHDGGSARLIPRVSGYTKKRPRRWDLRGLDESTSSSLLLLQDRQRRLGLIGGHRHVAGLASGFRFLHERSSLRHVSPRSLGRSGGASASPRSLHVLVAARSLDVLVAARRLNILVTTRRLHVLVATRGLDVLVAARRMDVLVSTRRM